MKNRYRTIHKTRRFRSIAAHLKTFPLEGAGTRIHFPGSIADAICFLAMQSFSSAMHRAVLVTVRIGTAMVSMPQCEQYLSKSNDLWCAGKLFSSAFK